MMDDFPTAWSPRKTILYLSSGGIVPFDKFKLLMLVILSFIFKWKMIMVGEAEPISGQWGFYVCVFWGGSAVISLATSTN
jgi:hypothetical protein